MNEVYDELYKIILAGDASVGKTNLVHKFVKGADQASKNISPTIGVQFATKMVKMEDGKRIKTQIWDTAGQEQYRSITTAHYRKAFGALVVYDITKERSFQNVKRWVQSIKDQADPSVVIIIVGNKTDLRNEQVVTSAEGKRLAKQLGVFYEETSALMNDNVQNTFMNMLTEIQKRRKMEENSTNRTNDMGFQLKSNHSPSDSSMCEC